MGPTWDRQDPDGPHVSHMDLVIWVAADGKCHPTGWCHDVNHINITLGGESTGHRVHRASDVDLWCFFDQSKLLYRNSVAGDWRHHGACLYVTDNTLEDISQFPYFFYVTFLAVGACNACSMGTVYIKLATTISIEYTIRAGHWVPGFMGMWTWH